MAHASLRQSDVSLTEAELSWRTLEIIDREVLRDIGIKSVGRQLEILQSLKQLIQGIKEIFLLEIYQSMKINNNHYLWMD